VGRDRPPRHPAPADPVHRSPGCGKTNAAEAVATEIGLPLVVVRIDPVGPNSMSGSQPPTGRGPGRTPLAHPRLGHARLAGSPRYPCWPSTAAAMSSRR
jgi:hypothetical protein